MVIKVKVKQNPLANCGNIITGERFVGRKEEIDTILNRILLKNGGNIAVMGLPRVGKSSLVWRALMDQRNTYLQEKILIIRINVGDIPSSVEFYRTLVNELYHMLKDEDVIGDEKINTLTRHKNDIFKDIDNISRQSIIWKFYKLIAREDIHVIYILDEFDYIGTIFKFENFQFLRELSIHPDTNIALTSISRRTIHEIELLGDVIISKLSTVFSDLNLGLFSTKDTDLYWERLSEFGIETDGEYQNIVKYYAGNHPYLMDTFNYEIINSVLLYGDVDNIDDIIRKKLRLKIYNQYDYIVSVLQEEQIYNQMMAILFGLDYSVDIKAIERLEKFGMIFKSENSKYSCFSGYFKEYIYQKIEQTTVEEKDKVFLSYQSSTNELAAKIEEAVSSNIPNIDLIRDRKDLNYKDNILDFMYTIQGCKHVIMIVGDEFIKSRYCMKEAIILFDDINFKQKIIPLVVDNTIYDAEASLEYVLHWEAKKERLQNKINLVKDNAKSTRAQQELVEIDNILSFLDTFIDYIESAYVQPIENHINEKFKTIIDEIKK